MELLQCKKRAVRLVLLVALAAACTLWTGCRDMTPASDESSLLVFETKHLDVGNISEGRSKTGEVSLSNIGNLPIEIERITASCGCSAAKIEPDIIPPNGKGKLIVELSAKNRRDRFGSSVEIRWVEKGGTLSGTASVVVEGNALFLANMSPSRVDFGTLSAESSAVSRDFTLTRGSGNIPFVDVSAKSLSDDIIAEVRKESENVWRISAEIHPQKLPAGPTLASIAIIFRDGNGLELARREVSVRAEIKGMVSTTPKSLYFGVLRPGESKQGTVSFEVPDGKSANIRSLRIEPSNDCIQFQEVGSSLNVNVSRIGYKVSTENKSGDMSGRIIVDFEDQELGTMSMPFIFYVKSEENE